MYRNYLFLLSLAGAILSFDQLSKLAALKFWNEERRALIPHFLDLHVVKNSGIALGWFGRAPASIQDYINWGVPILALLLIVLIFVKLQDNQLNISVALTLILAGAIGNLIDRLHYGAVIDFLCLYFFGLALPALNVADISILMGSSLVVIRTFRGTEHS